MGVASQNARCVSESGPRTPGWEGRGIAPLKRSSKDPIGVTCERKEENGFVPLFLAAKEQT